MTIEQDLKDLEDLAEMLQHTTTPEQVIGWITNWQNQQQRRRHRRHIPVCSRHANRIQHPETSMGNKRIIQNMPNSLSKNDPLNDAGVLNDDDKRHNQRSNRTNKA